MEFLAQQDLLAKAISMVGRAICKKVALPICHQILVDARKDGIFLEATNPDWAVKASISGYVFQEGASAIDGLQTQNLFKGVASDENLTMRLDETAFSFKSSSGAYSVPVLPACEFPILDFQHQGSIFEMDQAALKEGLKSIVFSVADSKESRAIMAGVYMEANGYEVKLISTDGRRMSVATLNTTESVYFTAVIPGSFFVELQRGLSEGSVSMSFDGHVLRVSTAHAQFYARCLEGCFPDYKRVVPSPKSYGSWVRVDRARLLKAVKRINKVTKPASRKTLKDPISLDFCEGHDLDLVCNQAGVGSASEKLAAVAKGQLKIHFNGLFLEEALAALDCEEVEMHFQDDSRSALLKPYNSTNYSHILMPIRVREVA